MGTSDSRGEGGSNDKVLQLLIKVQLISASIAALATALGILVSNRIIPNPANIFNQPTGTYSAIVPGPGCDKSGGQWNSTNADGVTTLQCSSSGLTVTDTNPGNYDTAAEVFFSWPQHPFPPQYTLQVDFSLLSSKGVTCAGLTTHRSNTPDTTHQGGYVYYLCSDNSLEIDRFSDSDNRMSVTEAMCQNCITSSNIYTMQVVVKGASKMLFINGVRKLAFSDNTYMATSQISLYVQGKSVDNSQSTAIFSNFSYMFAGTAGEFPTVLALIFGVVLSLAILVVSLIFFLYRKRRRISQTSLVR